jgi:hypothetical protein
MIIGYQFLTKRTKNTNTNIVDGNVSSCNSNTGMQENLKKNMKKKQE